MFTLWNTFHLTSLPNFHQEKSRLAESKSTKSSVKPPWSPCISHWICSNISSPQQEKVEYIFLVIFTAECVMKIIAYGLWQHPTAYLRSAWNLLDFTIVMIGWVVTLREQASKQCCTGCDVSVRNVVLVNFSQPSPMFRGSTMSRLGNCDARFAWIRVESWVFLPTLWWESTTFHQP